MGLSLLTKEGSIMSTEPQSIPERKDVTTNDTWDLTRLFTSDDEWETGLSQFKNMTPEIEKFKGTLGQSAARLRECLDAMNEVELLGERLGYYAMLRQSEDAGDSDNQSRHSRFVQASSKAEAAASYQSPEIQAIPDDTMSGFLADPVLADFTISLNKLLRWRPHILTEKEERLLAMQEEANQTASDSFGALTDVDMDFGSIETPEGPRALSHGSFGSLMEHADRDVRRRAYVQYYDGYSGHKNTLANLYAGSVRLDVYKAKARNFDSARDARLFPDKVPASVYDNLVKSVNDNLGPLHEYYEIRKGALGLDELRHYDIRVPLVPELKVRHTYDEAVDVIAAGLAPLGDEYVGTLRDGLLNRWVDRYENKGKRSGAFSAGSYTGNPYILMNYKEDVLRDVFTLAHEGGHSMHSWYSVRNNPFQHYNYTIFEAEVASTFNEQLLLKHFRDRSESKEMLTYLINKQIDDIVGTLYRQTMFAEYEEVCHRMVEAEEALTVDSLRGEYRKLLVKYFGPAMVLEEDSDMEGLRVPHFYRAFYVYKYATGISASITLAQRVLNGGANELEQYYTFLKSGGSRYPIESLRAAGVDMESPDPVNAALAVFADQVKVLKELLGTG
jgi:oligoendopeptidase F